MSIQDETISKELKAAREYQVKNMPDGQEGKRPLFHLSAPVGWINDPNGFSEYNGAYHLFYQYCPYQTTWGPMHWGHSKTHDLIRWEQCLPVLAPDQEYDAQGCFSGSAIEHEGKHILMYTGVLEQTKEDGSRRMRQTQCIAVGDGANYTKLKENPVITADMLPEGSSREDFRDPKIWKEDGKFYAVAGSRARDGSGQIPLFMSEDLKNWEFVTILDQCNNEYGRMWECPDFFSLDDKQVLITSPQDMIAQGLAFHNGNGTMYLLGSYDKEAAVFTREKAQAIDYGLDFYAPQTMQTKDGRRIMIGWMQSWDNQIVVPEGKWSGMMSIPRELSVRDGKLYQNPVRELENYHLNQIVRKKVSTSGFGHQPIELEGIHGRTIDLTVELDINSMQDCHEFIISLVAAGDLHTDLIYRPEENTLTFDRTFCGLRRDVISSRTMKINSCDGKVKLRIILDYYSLELFVNDGEQAMTSLYVAPPEAEHIFFTCDGDAKFDVTKYDIVLP